MVNILELELKSENKDQLLVAFGKTNPAAKKPCMSSCIFFSSGQSYTQPCLICCFQVIPCGLVLFQMAGNLNGITMMRSDMHGWPPVCIMRVVYFPLFKL
jgi:hypothetical protein